MSQGKTEDNSNVKNIKENVQTKFENIFMIDDDNFTLYLNRYFVQKYESIYNNLLEFQNAEVAIKNLKKVDQSKKHLVLLDLNMPIMSGWEFVNQISTSFDSEMLNCLYINIVSSSNNPKDIMRANTHPLIFSYIEKPFLPDQFENMVLSIDKHIRERTIN